MTSNLAQPPGHGSLYPLVGGPPGPGAVLLLVGNVDVDGGGVLARPPSWGELAQPGHGGLLLCWADCLTQSPAILPSQSRRKWSQIFLPFSLSAPGVGEPGGGTFIWELEDSDYWSANKTNKTSPRCWKSSSWSSWQWRRSRWRFPSRSASCWRQEEQRPPPWFAVSRARGRERATELFTSRHTADSGQRRNLFLLLFFLFGEKTIIIVSQLSPAVIRYLPPLNIFSPLTLIAPVSSPRVGSAGCLH